MNNDIIEKAKEIVAQCWCEPETSNIVMIPELAEAFAKRLAEKMEVIYNLEQKLAKQSRGKAILEE